MEENNIIVRGARENNLKNISVKIPKKKITVFTGVSGSGKTSLVFDTIAAESQRLLNETYSSFIRHRLQQYGKPDVDSLQNLAVTVIVNQKRLEGSARSTVGTVTDIYSLLRLLFPELENLILVIPLFFRSTTLKECVLIAKDLAKQVLLI